MKKLPSLPDIPEQDQTPVVQALLGLVEQLIERVQHQDEEIALLKDEINILKGEKKRPVFKGRMGSGLAFSLFLPGNTLHTNKRSDIVFSCKQPSPPVRALNSTQQVSPSHLYRA